MLKVDWLKPNKSDKGSIILHLNGRFNLHIWTKDNLEEWMLVIKESIARYQARRSCITQKNGIKILDSQDFHALAENGNAKHQETTSGADDLYENTGAKLNEAIVARDDTRLAQESQLQEAPRSQNNSNNGIVDCDDSKASAISASELASTQVSAASSNELGQKGKLLLVVELPETRPARARQLMTNSFAFLTLLMPLSRRRGRQESAESG